MAEYPYQFGFIGMGNMGYAMLKGLLSKWEPEKVTFSARNREKMELISARTAVTFSENNRICAEKSRFLVLAVKPQQFDTVIGEIRDVVKADQVIITLAPGISMENIRGRFGKPCRVVRAMPNTPALVGEGMTGVCWRDEELSEAEKETLQALFESFGRMVLVEERLMDAVGCASGCSPAYVYMFMEALADSVVKYGLPRATAYEMVAQTVLGSAKMLLETGEHPGALKDKVCSPGGTTIQGVAALEEYGMRNAIIKATDAVYEKSSRMQQAEGKTAG